MNEDIINNMNKHNLYLSKYACQDKKAIRLLKEKNDFRSSFFKDIDRIIYSLSYNRYIDKTQVFTYIDNDLISKRMTHVQLVSKIARTIGRALNLNEDLIEAASLGHDLGHTPFGHVGEKILNDLSIKYNEGYFNHNVQSVRILMNVENYGQGSNISLQVLDAILCHNGESLSGKYFPVKKSKLEFLNEYSKSYEDKNILLTIKPMTLEGCVVRISDIIAYIGKDIEDAIRLNRLKLSDIPNDIQETLGKNNSEIINTIVCDIVKNSLNHNYIKISNNIFESMNKLIKFNYENIYLKVNNKQTLEELHHRFEALFDLYYKQINKNQINEDIFVLFLNNMDKKYIYETSPARKVIDFISGMTDDFFDLQYKKYFK